MLSLLCTQTVSLLDSPSNSNYFAAVRIYSVEVYLSYIISKCPSRSGLNGKNQDIQVTAKGLPEQNEYQNNQESMILECEFHS